MAASIRRFNGLNNVSDPIRLGLDWLATASNVNITDTGAIAKRQGYSRVKTGSYTGVFSTSDHQRLYLVDGGVLKTFDGAVLATGLSAALMSWTELNDQVLYTNGTDAGIIQPDNTVLVWRWSVPAPPAVSAVSGTLPAGLYRVLCTQNLADGRETGPSDPVEIELVEGQALQIVATGNVYISPANSTVFQYAGQAPLLWNQSPDALGRDLTLAGFDPLPLGVSVIQSWRGRIYTAMYMPAENQSVVWFSEPFGPHLFNLAANFFMVPGQVHMLAPHTDALIVGTDAHIYAYTTDRLAELAPYGVVPGQHWDTDDNGRVLFWSSRGACAALPFLNLTERSVSVAPGIKAGGAIVRRGGQKRFLVSIQQGGFAFNDF